jgi:hypothetical protein
MIHHSHNGIRPTGRTGAAKAPGQCEDQTRYMDVYHPAFFAYRFGKDRPWAPAVIWRPCPFDRPRVYEHVDGRREPLSDPETWCREVPGGGPSVQLMAAVVDIPIALDKLWMHGRFIPFWRWRHMMATVAWARKYEPWSPAANPLKRIDIRRVKTMLHEAR